MTSQPASPVPADNHAHTQWSWDTGNDASMERSCARAVQLGVPAIAFTEHVDFTAWGSQDAPPSLVSGLFTGPPSLKTRHQVGPLDVEGYLTSVEKCRALFPALRILTGIEAGEPHLFPGSLAAVLQQAPFERVLGSLHSVVVGDRLVSADSQFGRLPAHDVMRAYFTALLDLIDGSDAFQVLAHCDFPRRYWPSFSDGPYDESDFEEEYRTAFRALATSGRALEINTRSPIWSAALMRWWYDEGGEAVSFGSDAHNPQRVAARFDLARDVVEAAGFRPGHDRYDFWRR